MRFCPTVSISDIKPTPNSLYSASVSDHARYYFAAVWISWSRCLNWSGHIRKPCSCSTHYLCSNKDTTNKRNLSDPTPGFTHYFSIIGRGSSFIWRIPLQHPNTVDTWGDIQSIFSQFDIKVQRTSWYTQHTTQRDHQWLLSWLGWEYLAACWS